MRIGIVYPDVRRWPKMRWVACALRNLGHEVEVIRTVEKLANAECDLVVFAHKGAGVNGTDVVTLSQKRTCPWVAWWFDLLAIEANKPLAEQSSLQTWTSQQIWEPTDDLVLMRALDAVFVKERGLLGEYRDLGVNAQWLDQGCPSWLGKCEHREIPEWDVLVYGTTSKAWRQRRHDVSDICGEGFAVAWAGHAAGSFPTACLSLPWCPPAELPALASRAAITLCVNLRSDMDGYTSDRFWLALGMGACVLARRWPGMPNHPHAVRTYESSVEMLLAIKQLRADRGARAAQGTIARRWVMGEHTIERQCERLIELCAPLRKDCAASAAGQV